MTRRLLEAARGVIVHSQFMEGEMRAAGFTGPIARIPHGAWIPEADRNACRYRLGLDEATPLIGIFGFLKPYKRIAESLRAFRRLVRAGPRRQDDPGGRAASRLPAAVADPLPGPLRRRARARLRPHRGFRRYMAACDIVLNLRYPTVGESSGSLLRALGLGKAVLVSDVGAFQEFPDDVCLKVPVGPGEEDLIFEYLNLLVSRPDVARALGERAARLRGAKNATGTAWRSLYAAFLEVGGREQAEWQDPSAPNPSRPRQRREPAAEAAPGSRRPGRASAEYVASWAADHEVARATWIRTRPAWSRRSKSRRPAARRSHPGDGRVSANHARAALQARLRRCARLLLRPAGQHRPPHA